MKPNFNFCSPSPHYNYLYTTIQTYATMSKLLQPTVLGDDLTLRNRICMGAMTRNRCVDDSKSTQASATHYAELTKDGAGLIVAEGIFISLQGTEWPHAPAMFD